ncbi:MAG: FimV/HubP family polar landmark protein [Steroidobacteraceae bacterium]
MPRGKTALTLMMALALPGAAQALGLGEIHLVSALNEPLAADIDIIGATAEDLAGITASIANPETFAHFGVDRPAFLSTVALKISHDGSGRVLLTIRTTDACTEPVLDMLVDLRWRGGEVIRHYTLLLDPPGFHPIAPVARAVAGVPASYTVPLSVRPAVSSALIENSTATVKVAAALEKASTTAGEPAARKTIRIGAKATLRGVAWRVGARSDADLKKMMMAIFRANPNAFEGNINRLRRGAVLTIPSAIEVSAISAANANRDVAAQMQAWHASIPIGSPIQSVAPTVEAPVASTRKSAVRSRPAAGSSESLAAAIADAQSARRTAAEAVATAQAALDRRLQQPESGPSELPEPFDGGHDALVRTQARSSLAEISPAAEAPALAKSGAGLGSRIAAILAFAAAAFGIYAWRRQRERQPQRSPLEPKLQDPAPAQVSAQAAVCAVAEPSVPVPVEPQIVPQQAHDTPSVPALNAETGERQWVADALARRQISLSTEPDRAANPKYTIDLEKLELSYQLQGNDGLDATTEFRDTDQTVRLPAPAQHCVDDPTIEMMPVDAAAVVGILESTTPAPGIPETATPAIKAGADATKLDYNLLDLDVMVQHVQMPSALHENVAFKERRTSLVDALKSATAREPHRRDLQMKLLETYFAAAASNRQGFLDVVQKIAQERASLNEGEWNKIVWMGQQIASDNALFAPIDPQPEEEDLADCA